MVLDSLEGDGISDVLLHSLWTKDELGYGPSIWLPDTIVYKFGQPIVWYFTGVDGKLKKKNKQNLVGIKIEEAFNRSATCDIVGYYISETVDKGSVTDTTIEYLDRKGLHDFLYNRWKENNGMLQRFLEPSGIQNAIVRAIWSPKVCLLERRLNTKQLHDQRYGLYERAVTYEGPEHFSEAAPLRGSTLPNQIQKLCENIEAHIAEVSFRKHRISRMVVNFKVDARNRIWLLWSSSIRLAVERDFTSLATAGTESSTNAINIDSIIHLPPDVELVDKASHSDSDVEPIIKLTCTSCGQNVNSCQFHPVQYKVIIAHFEQLIGILKIDASHSVDGFRWPPDPVVLAAAGGVGFGMISPEPAFRSPKKIDLVIPPIIRKAHPTLTVPVYDKYRRDPIFLYKTIRLCEGCFLAYAELATIPRSSHVSHPPGVLGYDKFDRPPVSKPPPKQPPPTKKLPPATRQLPKDLRDPWMPIDAPTLPEAIYNATASTNQAPARQQTTLHDFAHSSVSAPCHALSMEELLKQREEAFFRDVYGNDNKDLTKGHPLTHMVTTQSILKMASAASASLRGTAPGKPKKSPYAERPILVESSILPGGHPKKTNSVAGHSSHQADSFNRSSSSLQHREFLMKTLEEVQNHLFTPNVLHAWKDRAQGEAISLLSPGDIEKDG